MGRPTPCLQVERFQVEDKRETEDVAVPQGSGERLRDIPNIAFKMGKLTGAQAQAGAGAARTGTQGGGAQPGRGGRDVC